MSLQIGLTIFRVHFKPIFEVFEVQNESFE